MILFFSNNNNIYFFIDYFKVITGNVISELIRKSHILFKGKQTGTVHVMTRQGTIKRDHKVFHNFVTTSSRLRQNDPTETFFYVVV